MDLVSYKNDDIDTNMIIINLIISLLIYFFFRNCQSKSQSGKDSGKVWPAEKVKKNRYLSGRSLVGR